MRSPDECDRGSGHLLGRRPRGPSAGRLPPPQRPAGRDRGGPAARRRPRPGMRQRRRRPLARGTGLAGHGRRPVGRGGGAAHRARGGAGLGEQVSARRHDLSRSFPAGRFDLVTSHYLHTPYELDRGTVLRRAAQAPRPGGRLLALDHGPTAPGSWDQGPDVRYPSPTEVAEGLALDPATWTVDRADASPRTATGPDGSTAEVTDHILLVRRTG